MLSSMFYVTPYSVFSQKKSTSSYGVRHFLSVSHVTKTFDHVTKRLDVFVTFVTDPCLISFYQHFMLYFTDSFLYFPRELVHELVSKNRTQSDACFV